MRSFEHGYLFNTPISHSLLMAMRSLGEFRGRQVLYSEQSPEVLETLRQVAMVQSTESSNRIKGITVAVDRIEALVRKKVTPRDRSEQEKLLSLFNQSMDSWLRSDVEGIESEIELGTIPCRIKLSEIYALVEFAAAGE
jgi:hypothetical protein